MAWHCGAEQDRWTRTFSSFRHLPASSTSIPSSSGLRVFRTLFTVTSHQSTVTSHQSTANSPQSPVPSHQSTDKDVAPASKGSRETDRVRKCMNEMFFTAQWNGCLWILILDQTQRTSKHSPIPPASLHRCKAIAAVNAKH